MQSQCLPVASAPECDPSVRRGEANQLRDRYQMIVEQITSMQRDGVLSGTVSDWHYSSRRPAERAATGQRNASSRPSSSRPSSSRGGWRCCVLWGFIVCSVLMIFWGRKRFDMTYSYFQKTCIQLFDIYDLCFLVSLCTAF